MAIKRKDPGAEERGTSGVGGAVSAGGSSQAGGVGRSGAEDEGPDVRDTISQQRQSESGKSGSRQAGVKPDPKTRPTTQRR